MPFFETIDWVNESDITQMVYIQFLCTRWKCEIRYRGRQFLKDEDSEITAIVSLIYESIFSPQSWTGLDVFEGSPESYEPSTRSVDFLSADHLEPVMPHVTHALKVAEKKRRVESTRISSSQLSHEVALPVIVVERNLDMLSATANAQTLLSDGEILYRKNGKVSSRDSGFQRKLTRAVLHAIDSGSTTVLVSHNNAMNIMTVLVSPMPWEERNIGKSAALFLNHETNDITQLTATLTETYDLSISEAEVTAYLSLGFSLDDIAERKSRSINTIRTQIKSVYKKTNTSRQNELVALVLNGPSLWLRLLQQSTPASTSGGTNAKLYRNSNGSTISYGDYGPTNGTPVFIFHHLLGSLNEKPNDTELLERLGIRLIVPERPGIGLSSPVSEPSLTKNAHDIGELADSLKLSKFYALGLSSGGPYAAACAALLGKRVVKLGLAAAMYPIDELPKTIPIGRPQQFLTNAARYWPAVALSILKFRYRKLLENPEQSVEEFRRHGSKADRLLMQDTGYRRTRLQNLKRSRSLPVEIFAKEIVMLSQPWQFNVSDIQVPVTIWHGHQDDFFSVRHAKAMSHQLSKCDFHSDADWGHFFFYQEWERLLGTLVSQECPRP